MADKRVSVTLDIGADISKVRAAASQLQNVFKNSGFSPSSTRGLQSMFGNLDKALDELQKKSSGALSSLTDARGIDNASRKVMSYIKSITQEMQRLGQLGDTDLAKNINGLSDQLNSASKAWKEYDKSLIKAQKDQSNYEKEYVKLQKAYKDQVEIEEKLSKLSGKGTRGSIQYTKSNRTVALNLLNEAKKDLSIRKGQETKARNVLDEYLKSTGIVTTQKGTIAKKQADGITEDQIRQAEKYVEVLQKAEDIRKKAETSVKERQSTFDARDKELNDQQEEYNKLSESLKQFTTSLEESKANMENAKKAFENFKIDEKNAESFEKLKKILSDIFGSDIIKDIENTDVGLETLKQRVDSISGERLNELRTKFPELIKLTDELGNSSEVMGKKVEEGVDSFHGMNEAAADIEGLTSRLKYFFSLAGGFNLMRRAIRSAVTTTKELDAVMTQTAVVSEYTVGDMWKTLPQYSKEAKKLGAAIKDVYSAQTLYVQQGLNMNDAMDLGIETLKMARVANINAEEATNSMTAALRGFNMELTEGSAKRVNDVYSKLAQNTASNTQEISTAMTKTAALANSANMSFENTAAFLATIIESTREGAETAGTALKTVIARFTEVKKLYSENELTGTDEEGQEIDVNKISKALRTAGIDMNQFFTGAKGLDEIFLELGSKWNSLTTVQQRYIATMAAGSRQQSRFLALMQNYNRTVELTGMAYNSAGSGQEQFEKTLDSLEAKLNQFKDAWDTLIMGIANSDTIKGFIDFGTQILEVFNNIVNAISGGNGIIKSLSTLAIAIGTFKIGRGIFGQGGILGSLLSGKGIQTGEKFGKTFTKGFKTTLINEEKRGTGGFKTFFTRNGIFDNISKENQVEITEAFNKYKQGLINIQTQQTSGEITEEQANKARIIEQKKFETIGKSGGLATEQIDNAIVTGQLQQTVKDYNAIGNAAMLAGAGVYAVTSALEANGNVNRKVTDSIKGVGTGLMAMGGTMKVVTALGEAFGTSISSLAGPLGIAIGLLTTIYSIIDAVTESPAEKFERLSEESKNITQSVDKLKNKINDLKDKVSDIQSQEDAFSSLITGTEDWDTAVQNLNQSILELIRLYPELSNAVEFVDGKWKLNMEKYQKYLDFQQDLLLRTQLFEQSEKVITAEAEYNSKMGGDTLPNIEHLKSWYERSRSNFNDTIYTLLTDLEAEGDVTYKQATSFEWLDGIDDLLEDIYDIVLSGKVSLSENVKSNINLISSILDYDFSDSFIARGYIAYLSQEGLREAISDYRQQESNKEQAISTAKSQVVLLNFQNTLASKDSQFSKVFSEYMGIAFENAYNELEQVTPEQQEKIEAEYSAKYGKSLKESLASELGRTLSQITEEEYQEYLKFQIAAEKAIKETNLKYSDFQQINKTNPELIKFLEQGFSGLSVDTNIEKLKEYLEILKGIFSEDQIAQILGFKEYGQILGGFAQYTSKLQPNTLRFSSNIIQGQNLTYGQLEGFINLEKGLIARGGNLESFFKLLQQNIFENENTPINKLSDIINLITGTDFSSINSIDSFIRELEKLGIVLDKEVINNLKIATAATYKYSKESADVALSNLEKTKNVIQKVQQGESLTQEDIGLIDKAFGETYRRKNFTRYGENEFKYNQEADQIIEDFNDFVLDTISKELNSVARSVSAGQYIRKKLENNSELQNFIEEIFITNDDELKNIDETKLNNALGILGINTTFYKTKQEKIQALRRAYEPYGISGTNLATAQETQDYLEHERNRAYRSFISGQDVLNAQGGTNTSQELKARVEELGAGEQYLVSQDVVKFGKKYEDVLNALTIDSNKATKSFDNLTQAYKDNASALKKENKGTKEYGLALGNLTKSVKEAFGNNNKITEDFVDKHLDLFKDYANGVEGTEDKIRQVMLDEGIISGTTEQVNALKKAVEELNGADFSINGTANCDQAFSELAALYGSAKAAAAAMEALGYSVTWEPDGETTMIMPDGSTQSIPNYKAVVRNSAGEAITRNKSAGGGGGGGSKKFKNDFDKYYNQVEDINELERQRNLLEKDYNQLLKSEGKSGAEIYNNLKDQVKLLQQRRELTTDLAEKRKQQILDTMNDKKYKNVKEFAWWNEDKKTLQIDYDSINKVKDSKTGDLIKEYVSKLEGFQSQYDDLINKVEDIDDTLQEIGERGKEEYTTLEDRTRDVLIKKIQDKIDELSDVNESINNTNQKLFDSINETLSLQRQERSNAKTEEELSDKEKRLAYLQQDSSNANALEIARLQEELADERESYTDNLIDQKISELQRQNDEATQQREEQIELMQRSLDWQEKDGQFWSQAYSLISEGVDATGSLVKGSELETLLKSTEGWSGLSEVGQMNWLQELQNIVALGFAYLSSNRQIKNLGVEAGRSINFTDRNGKVLTGVVDENGDVIVGDTKYSGVFQDYAGTYRTFEKENTNQGTNNNSNTGTNKVSGSGGKNSGSSSGGKGSSGSSSGETKATYEGFEDNLINLPDNNKKEIGYYNLSEEPVDFTKIKSNIQQLKTKTTYKSINDKKHYRIETFLDGSTSKNIESHNWKYSTDYKYCKNCQYKINYPKKAIFLPQTLEKNKVEEFEFATGGLADYTGPAWLDGTKSHPELVLNARDTQNFIELKDTLSTLKSNNFNLLGNGGNNYYDIQISVDQMSSDYDVDRAIDRIKARIAQDNIYRSVNTLSRLR